MGHCVTKQTYHTLQAFFMEELTIGGCLQPPTLYRSAAGEAAIRALYEKTLACLPFVCESGLVPTAYGSVHVLVCGPAAAQPLVLWHGACCCRLAAWLYSGSAALIMARAASACSARRLGNAMCRHGDAGTICPAPSCTTGAAL
jgi:hypothetical protein